MPRVREHGCCRGLLGALIVATLALTFSVAQRDARRCWQQSTTCRAPLPVDTSVAETTIGPDETTNSTADASPTPDRSTTPLPIMSTRGVGIAPVSDTEAANRVRPVAENRPANVDENHYRPTAAELTAFRTGRVDRYGRTMLDFNPLTAHVTGGFTGTTDEILQWAAHKWGIPEDVIRAAAVTESDWNMSKLGDRRTVADPSIYPGHSRIAGTSDVYESLGILQVKWNPDTHWGTEPLRWKSTAFNADYWAATVRYYYDGRCDWCAPGYSSGRILASVGAWYNPSPWVTGSLSYVSTVTANLAARRWERAGFLGSGLYAVGESVHDAADLMLLDAGEDR